MADSQTPLLWICPKIPHPPSDGARHASAVLIRELARSGTPLDLVCLIEGRPDHSPEEVREALGCRRVYFVPRPPSPTASFAGKLSALKRLPSLPSVPITYLPYSGRELQQAMAQVYAGRVEAVAGIQGTELPLRSKPDWKAVVYDGLHAGVHLFQDGKVVPPNETLKLFYRAHNCEAEIWQSKAERSTKRISRWLMKQQAELVHEWELRFMRKLTGCLAVSDEDLEKLRRMLPRLKGTVVPIGYEITEEGEPCGEAHTFGFIGRLDWPPNREGLEWFLDEVWPSVVEKQPTAKVLIAGSGDGAYLEQYRALPGVELLGFVDSVGEIYNRSLVSLAPIFFGSGTRVKVIEASSYGCPMISTAFGVRGSGLEPEKSYMRAESSGEWIWALVDTPENRWRELGKAARETVKARFDPEAAAKHAKEFLSEEQL